MRKCGLVALSCALTLSAAAQDVAAFEKAQVPALVETYKGLHAHPELSRMEEKTSALVADELRKAGYTVTDHVGVYPDGLRAFGVVGILKNGAGPTVLIRADMDALPVTEETGLSYASHVMAPGANGQMVGVMHACGHDIHTTVLIGTARALAASKASWHGTVMLVAQPAEEAGGGAKAMLADHLYERFGRPDRVIGLHDSPDHPAGVVGVTSGPAMAGSDTVSVTIQGIGGHGAKPFVGRDPVVLAAMFIMELQTIVSRENDPRNPAVITVGSIHGGTKANIIPDSVQLELSLRYFSLANRELLMKGIRQMAEGVAVGAGLPKDKFPVIKSNGNGGGPLINDVAQTGKVRSILVVALGKDNVVDDGPLMPSEDVGLFGLEGQQIPVTYLWLGAMYPDRFAKAKAAGEELPGWHTSRFEPDPEPTIATGVKTLTAVATGLLP